ncbi:uncharacterized protein SCODWIG_01181 [Saccharomycodes ludwigii]|uniref:DUF2415 domain-containing protein n=1 Tax=Saccharomycodes ludwigii TaxID=36035 RepID=A0A376B5L5_9ASCO|nr:uncharacterized protein SCODWIG_01181 [Saccharomycodes ludwigii]
MTITQSVNSLRSLRRRRGIELQSKNNNNSKNIDEYNQSVYKNFLSKKLSLYDVRVTINHWQLRDLVKGYKDDQILYCFENSIRALNTGASYDTQDTASSNSSFYEDKVILPFKPKCFRENSNILVCGGVYSLEDESLLERIRRRRNQNLSNLLDSFESVVPNNTINNNTTNGNNWKGLISITPDISSTESIKTSTYKIGQYINNDIEISSDGCSGKYEIFSCNNDSHLYHCDVSNSRVTLLNTYSDLKFPLNSCKLSHDGKMMAVSGDSNKFALYHRSSALCGEFFSVYSPSSAINTSSSNTNSNQFNRVPRYAINDNSYSDKIDIFESIKGDHGFSTSFSQTDYQFSTIFQNGVCLIYDTRKMNRPIHIISTSRPKNQAGSFRCCKYSGGLDDLLFISEHASRVHVIDTRNFNNHLVIKFADKVKFPEMNPLEVPNYSNTGSIAVNESIRGEANVTYGHARNSILENAGLEDNNYNILKPRVITFHNKDKLHYLHRTFGYYNTGPDFLNPLERNYNDDNSAARENNSGGYENSNEKDEYTIIEPEQLDLNVVATSQLKSSGPCNIMSEPKKKRKVNVVEGHQIREHDNNNIGDDHITAPVDNSHNETSTIDNAILSSSTSSSSNSSSSSFLSDPFSYGSNSLQAGFYSRGNIIISEDNDISGIDWVQNGNGSSLLIGTSFGIYKWNVDSWSRRSFNTYDFC